MSYPAQGENALQSKEKKERRKSCVTSGLGESLATGIEWNEEKHSQQVEAGPNSTWSMRYGTIWAFPTPGSEADKAQAPLQCGQSFSLLPGAFTVGEGGYPTTTSVAGPSPTASRNFFFFFLGPGF